MYHILKVQDPDASSVQRHDNVNSVRFLFVSPCTIILAMNITAIEFGKIASSFLKCQLLVSGSPETNTRHLLEVTSSTQTKGIFSLFRDTYSTSGIRQTQCRAMHDLPIGSSIPTSAFTEGRIDIVISLNGTHIQGRDTVLRLHPLVELTLKSSASPSACPEKLITSGLFSE
jgi:hypothetical protein